MARSTIKMKDGEQLTVQHQFGTVRRNLNDAAIRAADEKSGKVEAFAEFNTDEGRVGVNPSEVSIYREIKGSE